MRPVDVEDLTKAHIALARVEAELVAAGRDDEAYGLCVADAVVLNLRHWLQSRSATPLPKLKKASRRTRHGR